MNNYDLPTPAALIDLDVLEKNIRHMADISNEACVKLRPHIKSHKIPEIAKMQIAAGAVGITCAKVSEAEVMARAGIRDILIAYPVVGDVQIRKLIDLMSDCSVAIGFDSTYGAERINEIAIQHGTVAALYMVINTGLNRDGVSPGQEALDLALSTSSLPHVKIKGIMTHEGHV